MMSNLLPLQLLLTTFAGWLNRHQAPVIEYLVEENRVIKEQLGGRRLRLTDVQRRRLAARGKVLGRQLLASATFSDTTGWCQDTYHLDYERALMDGSDWSRDGLRRKNAAYRVVRGGRWFDRAKFCRSSHRSRWAPDGKNRTIGCRPAFSLRSERE